MTCLELEFETLDAQVCLFMIISGHKTVFYLNIFNLL